MARLKWFHPADEILYLRGLLSWAIPHSVITEVRSESIVLQWGGREEQ